MEQQEAIHFKELFGFGLNCNQWDELFGHLRVEGYARALTTGVVDRVRIFCPSDEFQPIVEAMLRFGAPKNAILFEQTLATTYYNGRVMREALGRLDLKRSEVCGASSGFHLRAVNFASMLHDLRITFVPAEAFIFAAVADDEEGLAYETDRLCREFGGGQLAELVVKEVRGIGRRLVAQYDIPPQSRNGNGA